MVAQGSALGIEGEKVVAPKGRPQFSFSVSESNVPHVRRYIESQQEHHSKISFQDEFRELCRRHSLEIDERYVWD